jgi:hypothetical protein
VSDFTVGVEHEWSDVDRWAAIPEHLGKWSTEDYTIVNSDGHANDPTGTTWRWGGEINTTPTATAEEQVEIMEQLKSLLSPVVNYKSNLHVHVGNIPGSTDVDVVKGMAGYLRAQEAFVYAHVDPIPRPVTEDPLEIKRWRRNLVSHHYSLPPARYDELMRATTMQELHEAHAFPTKNGGRAWHLAPRPGMNLRSLQKHGTIEFRHFYGTLDPTELRDAVRWCRELVMVAHAYAMHGDALSADRLYKNGAPWRFPRMLPFDAALQRGFEATKVK